MITAAIGAVTLGAQGARQAQGTTSETQPWSFAPNPVAAGGECALVKSSVSPTDDKKQVRVTHGRASAGALCIPYSS
jgi:hypothetical protein